MIDPIVAPNCRCRSHGRANKEPAPVPFWHADCTARIMTDESYVSLLLWTICVLMFACGVVAITEHPNWFGA